MARYIDADALLEDIEQTVRFSCRDGVPSAELRGANKIIDRIKAAPTVSPDEVRGVGEWEDAKQHGLCRCSVCKDCYIEKDYITQAKWKYCPSCGAKMEVSDDA